MNDVQIFKEQRAAWRKCTKCGLHEFSKVVCVGTGSLPCDILFIGEAPNKTESMTGRICRGKTKDFINMAFSDAQKRIGQEQKDVAWYTTNVLACRPSNGKNEGYRDPMETEVWACQERLRQEIKQCAPKVIVTLGSKTITYCRELVQGSYVLQDPKWLIQIGGAATPQYKKFVADLGLILEGLK